MEIKWFIMDCLFIHYMYVSIYFEVIYDMHYMKWHCFNTELSKMLLSAKSFIFILIHKAVSVLLF